jgi:hypothetical protein
LDVARCDCVALAAMHEDVHRRSRELHVVREVDAVVRTETEVGDDDVDTTFDQGARASAKLSAISTSTRNAAADANASRKRRSGSTSSSRFFWLMRGEIMS